MSAARSLCVTVCLLAAVGTCAWSGVAWGNEGFPPDVIAEIKGGSIRAEDFRSYLDSKNVRLRGVPLDGREALLEEFIVDWKLAQEARERGLDKSDSHAKQIDAFEREHLPKLHFLKEFLDKASVEEKDFHPYYQGIVETVDIRTAVFDSDDEARAFLKKTESGSFEHLTRQHSKGLSAWQGGLVEDVTMADGRFSFDEKKAMFACRAGDMVGPFGNSLGQYTVIKVLTRMTVEDRKEEIRDEKWDEIRVAKANAAYLARLNEAMVGSEIEINEEFFENGGEAGPAPRRPYLAWVKGQYVYPGDLKIGGVKGSHAPTDIRASLDRHINSIFAREMAAKAGVNRLPEYRAKREVFEGSLLAGVLLESKLQKRKLTATEKEVEEYYRENYQPEVYNAWVVMNEDPVLVEAARREALAGGDLAKIAEKYSTDLSRMAGGQIGLRPLPKFSSEARKVIAGMKAGEVSESFRVDGKNTILSLLEKRTVEVPPLSKVRDQVREKLLLQKRAKMVEAIREEVLRKAAPKIDLTRLEAM